ncbi:hypothetical protein L1987_72112 [Smallanthus sonchifolius]|uniref:Uncharacterized protein n=1 Tax=Smallanthus sonchifolius TaxID=185202 RepID=A0ACB9ATF9_9ASTR|nr:hypothetical protein L1987_72112 [Smallanthus sonchifolius]
MEKITVRLLFCLFLFKSISGTNECRPASCSPTGPQIIYIDPEFCRPKRIGDFSLTGTPFDFSSIRSYTFYNCSLQKSDLDFKFPAVPLPCLGDLNHSVIAVRNGLIPEGETPENCQRSCEIEGRRCGLKGSDGETTCFGSSGGFKGR